MKTRDWFFLTLFGLAVALGVASYQDAPGYMDAEYYFAGGLSLVEGRGFSLPFVWNYLDNPSGLPHASHAYWMPLVSLLAALGMRLLDWNTYLGAQIVFVTLAALVPGATALLSWRLLKRRDLALCSGLLGGAAGFYLPYLTASDAFTVLMLLGSAWLLAGAAVLERSGQPGVGNAGASIGGAGSGGARNGADLGALCLAWGAVSGLIHLARADGLVWLGAAGLALLAVSWKTKKLDWQALLLRAGALGIGYLLVMGPWLARNLAEFGAPFAPGSGRALWLTHYDDLYLYPADLLTPQRWLASGWRAILTARLDALGQNLQTALAVQGGIFLAPLIAAGAWSLRRQPMVRLGALVWAAIFTIMTVIFPFAGARGGFFHSGAGLQPLAWALAGAGLESFLAFGAKRRGWQVDQARRVFLPGMAALAFFLTLVVAGTRLVGADPASPIWQEQASRYSAIGAALPQVGIGREERVMVNNAPGFWLESQQPALTIPAGDLQMVQAVARRYDACCLVVEMDQIAGADLLAQPGDRPGLDYLGHAAGAALYRFTNAASQP